MYCKLLAVGIGIRKCLECIETELWKCLIGQFTLSDTHDTVFFIYARSLIKKLITVLLLVFKLHMLYDSETRDYKLSNGDGVWGVLIREEINPWKWGLSSTLSMILNLVVFFSFWWQSLFPLLRARVNSFAGKSILERMGAI